MTIDVSRSIQSAEETRSVPVREIWPAEAHELLKNGRAVLVDVRTAEERKFDGFVPDSIHIAWQTGPHFIRNPGFLRELGAKVAKDVALLFICRSGVRSADAAAAAARAGFKQVYNVQSGIEGDPDEQGRRGTVNGWRSEGLPLASH